MKDLLDMNVLIADTKKGRINMKLIEKLEEIEREVIDIDEIIMESELEADFDMLQKKYYKDYRQNIADKEAVFRGFITGCEFAIRNIRSLVTSYNINPEL